MMDVAQQWSSIREGLLLKGLPPLILQYKPSLALNSIFECFTVMFCSLNYSSLHQSAQDCTPLKVGLITLYISGAGQEVNCTAMSCTKKLGKKSNVQRKSPQIQKMSKQWVCRRKLKVVENFQLIIVLKENVSPITLQWGWKLFIFIS